MKERIGFIGIGQAGGNIVELLSKSGYKTFAVNTSQEDLDLVDIENKYLVPGGIGCNHDRAKSIQLAKEHYKEILGLVEEYLKGCEIIYTVFSTGGGTGSGMGLVLTELLAVHLIGKKTICSVCILPSSDEPIKAQLNAYESYTKLTTIRNLGGIFTLDNDKGDKLEINKEFVENFNRLVELPKYTSIKGNIDVAEVLELLKTRGNTVVANYKNYLDIPNVIKESIYAELEDDKKIMYIALSLHEDMDKDILENNVGVPYDMFINYNDTDSSLMVLSGLSFPQARVSRIKRKLENSRDHVKSLIENKFNNKIENDLNWITGNDLKVEPLEITDFESIFKKY